MWRLRSAISSRLLLCSKSMQKCTTTTHVVHMKQQLEPVEGNAPVQQVDRRLKQIVSTPTMVEGPLTVVNYLATMKRERRANRNDFSGVEALHHTVSFLTMLSAVDKHRWLSFDSALAVVAAWSFAGSIKLLTLPSSAVVVALEHLIHGRKQIAAAESNVSLEKMCRMVMALVSIRSYVDTGRLPINDALQSYLRTEAVVELSAALRRPTKQRQDTLEGARWTGTEASLYMATLRKLCQAVGPKVVQQQCLDEGVMNGGMLLQLLSSISSSSLSRDQLSSTASSLMDDSTLGCFISTEANSPRSDSMLKDLSSMLNVILCGIVDQRGERFGQTQPLKSHNIVVMLSTVAKLCQARNGSDRETNRGLSPLSEVARLLVNSPETRNTSAAKFLTPKTVEYLLSKASSVWHHFTIGEAGVVASSLLTICHEVLWNRLEVLPQHTVDITRVDAGPAKSSRFSKNKQRAAPLTSSAALIASPAPAADHMGWFFQHTEGADDVEFEAIISRFVDFIVGELPSGAHKRGPNGLDGTEGGALKELAMMRQALTGFGRSCHFLDNFLVKALHSSVWHQRAFQQVMRSVTAVANSPDPCLEHSVSSILHRFHFHLQHQGKQIFTPPHEVVEFLHAVVCKGGLRRYHGAHLQLMEMLLSYIRDAMVVDTTTMSVMYRIMLLECLLQYVQGWQAPADCGGCPLMLTVNSVCQQLVTQLALERPDAFQSASVKPLEAAAGSSKWSAKEIALLPSLVVTIHTALNATTAQAYFNGLDANATVERMNVLARSHILRWDVGLVAQSLSLAASRRKCSDVLLQHRNGLLLWFSENILRSPHFVLRCKKSSEDCRFGAVLLSIAAAGDEQLLSNSLETDALAAVGGVPAELWSSAQASLRTLSQVTALARICDLFLRDGLSTAPFVSLVTRKVDQLLLRTGHCEGIVMLLDLIGPSEPLCGALAAALERDLGRVLERSSQHTFISPAQFLAASEHTHVSMKAKVLPLMVPLGCAALTSAAQIDEVLQLMLMFAPVVSSDDLVKLARSIPPHVSQSTAPAPSTFVRLLHYFRVGKQTKSVQHIRGLLGSLLKGSSLLYSMRMEDVLQLVDVPDSLRVGSYGRITHRALFKRVRRELGLGTSFAEELATPECHMDTVLAPMTVDHWILALTFTRRSPHEDPDDSFESTASKLQCGTELLTRMMCEVPQRQYLLHLVTARYSVADSTRLLKELVRHWETVPLHPAVSGVDCLEHKPLAGPATQTVERWVSTWSAAQTDGGMDAPFVECELFQPLVDALLDRLLMVPGPDAALYGASFVELLTWGPRECRGQLMLSTVCDHVRQLRGRTEGTVACVGVDKLVAFGRQRYDSLERTSLWLHRSGGAPPSAVMTLREEAGVARDLVEHSLWLQWRAMEAERQRSAGGASSKSLTDLTASSACGLWLDLRWWSSLTDAAAGDRSMESSTCWWIQLQHALTDTLFDLLQSADGSALAHVVQVLIPTATGGERITANSNALEDLAVQRVLGRVSMLLGTDLDNFSIDEVMVIAPRLARGGFLTRTTLESVRMRCAAAATDGEVEGPTSDLLWKPAPRRQQGLTTPASFDTVSTLMESLDSFTVKSTLAEDDV